MHYASRPLVSENVLTIDSSLYNGTARYSSVKQRACGLAIGAAAHMNGSDLDMRAGAKVTFVLASMVTIETYVVIENRPLYWCLYCPWWTASNLGWTRVLLFPYIPTGLILLTGLLLLIMERGTGTHRAANYSRIFGAAVLVCNLIAALTAPVWWYIWLPTNTVLLVLGVTLIRWVSKCWKSF